MKKHLSIAFGFLVLLFALGIPAWLSWAAPKQPVAKPDTKITKPVVKPAVKSASTNLPPNEAGEVMVLEYHLIGYPEADWKRTPENFLKDLEMLYANGYYPVSLSSYVKGELKVPAGKTPFVMTFDDSSNGQFNYLNQNGKLVIDPKCAVGMMEQFKKTHPDFPLTATFYVLPAIKEGLRLFGQEEYIQQKFDFLVKNGYEIGNHSFWHQNLGKTDDAGVQKQLALAVKAIQSYVPGYQMRSLALPLGVHPKNRILETKGTHEGITYQHDSVMLVGSGSAPSPFLGSFNPNKLERIQAGDTPWGPKAYVERYRKHPDQRFVSDGNPKTITVLQDSQSKLKTGLNGSYQIKTIAAAPKASTKS